MSFTPESLELDQLIKAFERFQESIYANPPGKNHVTNNEIHRKDWDDIFSEYEPMRDALANIYSLAEIRALDPGQKSIIDGLAASYMLTNRSTEGDKDHNMKFVALIPNSDLIKEYAEMRCSGDWDDFICPKDFDRTKLKPYRRPRAGPECYPRQVLAEELSAIFIEWGMVTVYDQFVAKGMEGAKFSARAVNHIQHLARSSFIEKKAEDFLLFLQKEHE